ncbi:MAG: peptidase [Candidatus Marinimicrobia bacterium]|nr:peptidase [Candidatus Neomarinimicrobiota bacterium]|tara:strand:+ start:23553 stop:26750 length:3198 start_codon:yes stop_codon:yes gene_type:complete
MQGYYRFPTIHGNQIAFISEDDIWTISNNSSTAIRLTNNIGQISSPSFSPDGKWIAYVGREDGNTEIYIMPSSGGISKRLTFDGAFISKIATWKNNNEIVYASDLKQAFSRISDLRIINIKGGESKALNYGVASNIAYSKNFTVLGRNTQDPARWKRYKGGTAGELWIDKKNTGDFTKLININGNMACPMVINDKIYFLSDHDGICNIYSCNQNGKNLKQHTFHKNYYARNASTDGTSIVYHSGADLYSYNIKSDIDKKIDIIYNSGFIKKSRKFDSAFHYLENISTNSKGNISTVVTRGKLFSMGNWEGPVIQLGKTQGVRYGYSTFLTDDKTLLTCSDDGGEERLETYNILNSKRLKVLKSKIGRPISLKKSPKQDQIAIVNHQHKLLLIDLKKDSVKVIDHSSNHVMQCNWSPDGNYIAYTCSKTSRVSIIKIYDLTNKKSHDVTDPINSDYSPVFDNTGSYLAFTSKRTFNPVYDSIQFDLNFTCSEKPYIIALNKNIKSPFIKQIQLNEESSKKKDTKKKKEKAVKVKIDFKGIKNRIMQIPVRESILGSSIGFFDNKLYYLNWPVEGSRTDGWYDLDGQSKGTIKYYDLNELEEKIYLSNVSGFNIDNRNGKITISSNKNIRILDVKTPVAKDLLAKPDANKKTGLIDFQRIRLNIDINQEWHQMYREAWRLQRDFFWVPDMSKINWEKVYNRYKSLVDRAGSRSEFSDIVWEMQGELGTSHCYEFGGDYIPGRYYSIGMLGASFKYKDVAKGYAIESIAKGDLWDSKQSPLYSPGLNVKEGDILKEINNVKLTKKITPNELLVNQVNKDIQLSIQPKGTKKINKVLTRTIHHEGHLHYRDWVEKNREYVHKKSKNKIGYVHIPDMGADGYAEFHRYFLAEIVYDGLIVDVRYNGGGHVSQILLSKLAKKRLGFDITRWMGVEPYPSESPGGPMVAITNEYAGSDGDIFSHSWKLMNLGKLIGRRTWGGVIGIWPRNSLVDGTVTSQPEFSFWFKDVGWKVENYGTDVDIEVHITPKDYRNGIDTQLDKGIELVSKDLNKKGSVLKGDFKNKPNLKLPN